MTEKSRRFSLVVDGEFRGTFFSVIFAQQYVVQQSHRGPQTLISSRWARFRPIHQMSTVPTLSVLLAYETTPHLGFSHHDFVVICPCISSILKIYINGPFLDTVSFSLFPTVEHNEIAWTPTKGTLHDSHNPRLCVSSHYQVRSVLSSQLHLRSRSSHH